MLFRTRARTRFRARSFLTTLYNHPLLFDLLLLQHFIDEPTRGEVLHELQAAAGVLAGVYGVQAAVDTRVRSARKLEIASELRERIATRFSELRPQLEQHFGVKLESCESPQFLRYVAGDFFVAHQDGNTPLIRDDSMHRKISAILFLNREYEGGALVFHGRYPDYDQRHLVPAIPGALVAFRAETTHEVTPVTEGERYTIVTWYR